MKLSTRFNGHVTRLSDASTFDEICVNCGAKDEVPGGWGALGRGCPNEPTDVCNCRETSESHPISAHPVTRSASA
jgi:hypothetical protein